MLKATTTAAGPEKVYFKASTEASSGHLTPLKCRQSVSSWNLHSSSLAYIIYVLPADEVAIERRT